MKLSKRDLVVAVAAAVISGGVVGVAVAKQPHMDKALELLRGAKSQLQQANANKGGHRKKAMELIDRAIQEVRLGKVVGSS